MGRMSFTQELKELAQTSESMDAGGCWREVLHRRRELGRIKERARPSRLADARMESAASGGSRSSRPQPCGRRCCAETPGRRPLSR